MTSRLPARAPALTVLFVVLLACGPTDDPRGQDFDAEYETLIEEFRAATPDTVALEALVDRADALSDRIRDYRRDNRDDLPEDEYDRLRDLGYEVGDFERVIRVVGQLSNSADVEIEDFDAVNRRLGLEPRVLRTLDDGVELVRVDVGSFGSMLLRNPTKSTLIVNYTTNDSERPGGTGSAACESYSVMSGLFNSRDRDIESIELEFRLSDPGIGGCD